MRKTKFILGAGLLAMLSLSACSADEPVNGGEENNTVTGNVYVALRINDASSLGSRGTEGGYIDAVTGEHEVSSADFYFYDENGIFVSQANVWNEDVLQNPANDNINFKSTAVVVLKDLKGQGYPKYVVTVLNKPRDFVVADQSTMADMEAALSIISSPVNANGIKNEDGKFVMATTSYQDTNRDYYFATELVAANFTLTNPADQAQELNPANIYVERLASRVSLGFSSEVGVTDNGDGTYTKELTVTLAGDPNAAGTGSNIGAEKVYVQLLGWGLNATAKNTRMVKNINPNWAVTTHAEYLSSLPTWNKAPDHRSFWGKSYNYGASNALYPGDDATTNPWDGAWIPGGANGYPLNYVAYNNLTTGIGTVLYCPENTNTSAVVSANGNGSAITSVLIKAKVTKDAAGTQALDLVLYRGVLYEKEQYLNYMLNQLNQSGPNKLNYYTRTDLGGGSYKYEQINKDYIKLVDNGNGSVGLAPNEATDKFTTSNIYKSIGTDTYALIDASDLATFKTDLTALNATSGYEAVAYTGGQMYYNIPIQHFGSNDGAAVGTVNEAVYGVVRNHSYQITVNKIANLGQGVFDPTKKIVTPDPTPDQKLWNVGATINILSWKIVSQGVDL